MTEQIAALSGEGPSAAGPASEEPSSTVAIVLRFLGWSLVALGAWLLFVSPGEGAELYDRPIVNIHRLSIGVACTVSGVIVLCTASLHSAIRDVQNRLARLRQQGLNQ